ncbi:nucleoside recognition domain-containing protein [Amorphus orientalis]|uniref:Nucleoside transporter/FeoB GTPase Gate domain-containing protein n=1 Tax=Amorphus orientalis TaxID=649198 RepID=A0AAE3VNZ6_9HYPH|nr:nucleoside recognition domain-containing protein [Amorphus orientalis]MDQ0315145.1 hypothetical protein [Amorphus orientalis]
MPTLDYCVRRTADMLRVYWMLVRIIVPMTIATHLLSEFGVIDRIAPALSPLMGLYGLSPEYAFGVLTGALVGIWGGLAVLFTLVPAGSISVADMTIFSSMLLFVHALPVEQQIVARAGPSFWVTTVLRVAGGLVYAALLHGIFATTGWLSEPIDPAWIPVEDTAGWGGFLTDLGYGMLILLAILLALSWGMEILRMVGAMELIKRALAPMLRLAGLSAEATHFTAVGLVLGLAFGGGLLIAEARAGHVPPRQVFLACVFMGFAHGLIEDTLVVIAVGADVWGVLVGRVVFAVAASALVALVLAGVSDRVFARWLYRRREGTTATV